MINIWTFCFFPSAKLILPRATLLLHKYFLFSILKTRGKKQEGDRSIIFFYSCLLPPSWSVDNKETICFNESHSHELILIAVTQNHDIGVDLEYIRPDIPWEQIDQGCFSPRETVLHQIPAEIKTSVFFAGWTRKEAYLKATGKGLSLPLDQFDVSLIPGEPAKLLNTQWDMSEARRWLLHELTPCSGYVADLATVAGVWRIKCWRVK